jgi:RNA polymerase sigma-70 factor (ECF subfamily)
MQMAIPLVRFMFEKDMLRRLIQEAKAGNAASFERIVHLHERAVLGLAQRILLNREAAKDAAQEVFIRFHKNLSRLDEERDLGAWLYRATSNACFDILRRTKQDLPLDLLSEPLDGALNPEESMAVTQQRRLIFSALKELSPRERQAIVLRDLEGYSTGEVARILNSTEGTVGSQISTGRIKIKNFVVAQLGRRT